MDKEIKQWGFKNSRYDQRINFLVQGNEFIIVAIVVDDLAFSSNSPRFKKLLKLHLTASFDVKLFGSLTSFVGWNIIQRENGIKIDLRGYVEAMFKEHNMHTANAVRKPLPKDADVTFSNHIEPVLDNNSHRKYRSIIGSLMYLSVCSRPGISFSVSVLPRQIHSPTARHLARKNESFD